MSRINTIRLLSFALAFLLLLNSVVFASEPQDIIDPEQMTPQQFNYQTTEAARGTLIKETVTTGLEYYPLTYNIRFEQEQAKFVEYTVKTGDTVKSGDILARFTIGGSEAEFTRMKLDLQRTEEQTAEGIRERQKAIAAKRAEVNAAGDAYDKKILELSLKKMETELAQYKYRQQYSIDRQREACEKENTRRVTDVLVSPVSGVVSDLTYKKVDDAVSPNETLVVISSEEVMLLAVQNDGGGLRYNMPVEVKFGSNPTPTVLTGRVIAADDAISEKERTGYAFILLDGYDKEKHKLRTPKITAESIRLDNVLLVDKKAVTQEAGKYYVTKLTDGMVQKRYIDVGLNSLSSVWVLAGVEEGETLVLD